MTQLGAEGAQRDPRAPREMPDYGGLQEHELVPAAEFNVREFARTAVGSHRSELALDAYEAEPLDAATLELMDYLARVERNTLAQLRSVLVTPTHKDARVTAFLVTWAFEKYWIADALEAVLGAHDGYEPVEVQGPSRIRAALRSLAERVEPIRESVVANLIGEDVIAVHTMTGAIDEWITRAAYEALHDASEHAELRRMLERFLEVKQRHEVFFAAQSRDRLRRSPKAAALARKRLRGVEWPLGALDEAPESTSRFFAALLGDEAVASIDERIEAHPGLAGLGLLRRAKAEQSAVRWAGERLGRAAADVKGRIR